MVKEVMNDLFQGRVKFHDAMGKLGVSEEQLHEMIDEYEYDPTSEEILEANRIIIENLEYIEREISISCRKSTLQNIKFTSASEIVYNPAMADAPNINPKDLRIPTADVLSYPHKQPYHW